MRNYDEASVVRHLSRNKGVSINTANKHVTVAGGSTTVGNGTWGKIDYLSKHCGYTYSIGNAANVANEERKIYRAKKQRPVEEDVDDKPRRPARKSIKGILNSIKS